MVCMRLNQSGKTRVVDKSRKALLAGEDKCVKWSKNDVTHFRKISLSFQLRLRKLHLH
jgi:hypothetical protein